MKTLFAIFAITLFSTASFADDATTTTTVVERLTCTQISERMSELSAITDPDTATTDEIKKLKSDYRRNCSRSAAGRRTNTSGRTPLEPVIAEPVATPDADTTPTESAPDVAPTTTDTTPELTPEQILEQELANLDAGLCADGSEPNNFGCCGDEKFKDLGDTVFACCPPEGGDCFPPLK